MLAFQETPHGAKRQAHHAWVQSGDALMDSDAASFPLTPAAMLDSLCIGRPVHVCCPWVGSEIESGFCADR